MQSPFRVRFIRDFAITGGTQAIKSFGAMVGGVIVARALGASGKGVISVLVALGTMGVLLGSFGVHLSGVYFLGRFKSDREAVVSNNLLVGVLGGLLTGVILASVGIIFHGQLLRGIGVDVFLLFVISTPFTYFNEFGQRIALGLGRIVGYNLPELMEGSMLLAGTAAVIAILGPHLLPLVVLRVAIAAGISVFLFAYIRRIGGYEFRPSRRLLRRQFKYGIKNYTSSLLWLFLIQSDLVLCNYFLGSSPTGVYSVAISLGIPITMLASVMAPLVFQRVSSDETRSSRIVNTNRAVRVLVPLLALVVIILGASSKWVIALVYGSSFSAATEALVLLLPGLMMLGIETVLMSFLAGEGSPPVVYVAPLIGVVVNLGANLFAIPTWGINGAATTSSVGYIIVFLLVLRYYLRATQCRLGAVLLLKKGDLRALWRPVSELRSGSPVRAGAA